MTSGDSQPKNGYSIGPITQINGMAIGDHASGQSDGVGHPTRELVLLSVTGQDITVPPYNSPLVEHLLVEAGRGGLIFLSRYGRRIAAVIPADVAKSILAEHPGDDDDDLAARTRTTSAVWAVWIRRHTRGQYEAPAGAEQQSLLQRAIGTGEVQPPTERGWPDIIPELADLPSPADSLIAARERERG
jgi:hypothetical protein